MRKTVKRIIIIGVAFVLIFGAFVKYGDYLNKQEALQNSEVAQEEQLEQLESQMTDEPRDRGIEPSEVEGMTEEQKVDYIVDKAIEQVQAGETEPADTSEGQGDAPSDEALAAAGFTDWSDYDMEAEAQEGIRQQAERDKWFDSDEHIATGISAGADIN